MARKKSEEAIVEGDEEIRGMKRVNNEKDTRLAKKAKVEGNNKATELPIGVGDKGEGEAVMLCDVELNRLHTSTRDKTKEEEEAAALSDDVLTKLRTHTDGNTKIGDEVNRLRGLLADDPWKLSKNDVDSVIHYLKVDEIVSLVLKSGQGKGSDDGDAEVELLDKGDPYFPNSWRLFQIWRLMLRQIEKVKEADFPLLYRNLHYADFAALLLFALDSYSKRCCGGVSLLKGEDRDMIPKLCRVLRWKLFAHILSYKTSLPLFKFTSVETSEESNEELTPEEKEAAKSCGICFGEAKHIWDGLCGYKCSFLYSIPEEVTVGHDYWIICKDCWRLGQNPFYGCVHCGSEVGQVVPIPKRFKSLK